MQVTRERAWAKSCAPLIYIGLLMWPILLGGMKASGATDSALQVSPGFHDFGAVKRLGGQVYTSFIVYNQGETPIILRRIWTS